MNNTLEFLKESGAFYLATTEGNQPRVRPFAAVFEYEAFAVLYFTKGTSTIYSYTEEPETFSL